MVVNNAAPRSSGKTLRATQFVFIPTEGMALFVDKPKQTPSPQYSNLMTLSFYALHSNTSLCGFVPAQGKRIFRFNDHILTQNPEF